MQLLKNLYALDGSCYGTLGNIYAIRYSAGIVLIDAGVSGRSEAAVEQRLAYWGLSGLSITHILITHGHWDHLGCADYFQGKSAKVVAHQDDAAIIEAGGPTAGNPFDHQTFPACRVDIRLSGDQTLSIGELAFRVIHAPGHTPGTVIYEIYMDGKQIWFVGDFICPDSIPAHNVKLWWTGDQWFSSKDLVESSKKIWREKPDCVLGGHGYLLMDGAGDIPKTNYKNILLQLPSR